jgi:hypothetical protein
MLPAPTGLSPDEMEAHIRSLDMDQFKVQPGEMSGWDRLQDARRERERVAEVARDRDVQRAARQRAEERRVKVEKKLRPFTDQPQKNRAAADAADEKLLPRFVQLIIGGEVTKTARAKMGLSEKHAKRIRALAVRRGLLKPGRQP